MIEQVCTIGAYGFSESTLIEALKSAGVDLFVDIRARRGVRGSAYAFANAKRLQASLAAAGIAYTHVKELAPTQSVRDAQVSADAATRTLKRDRSRLSPVFVEAYICQCLHSFDATVFSQKHCADAKRPVLFCVEREPAACHRSLAAAKIAEQLSIPIRNLMP